MKLVIVESPSKTKTIKQYLGSEYEVVASKGHIRDIANKGIDNLGLDFENNLKPIYSIIDRQHPTIKYLNGIVSKADEIYLATDPDREGEAISWHLKEVLKLNPNSTYRIEFNEITRNAVLNAIESPRNIDMLLVDAQETRKIIDRIIGFKLSTLLKKSIASESAGRVQSVALKLVTDLEAQIKAFVSTPYFEIEADFGKFKSKITEANSEKVWLIKSKEEADETFSKLGNKFTTKSVSNRVRYEKPLPPFITSTLIQTCSNKFSLSSSSTMRIAQQLYEGVEIEGKHIAFITYMRTDSTRIADVFKWQLIDHIKKNYGDEYLGYAHMQKNTENVQDAHECIRPVSLSNRPESMKEYLSKDQYNVYSLIYSRTVASMMKDAQINVESIIFDNNNYNFLTSLEKVLFDGYKKAYNIDENKKEKSFYYDAVVGEVKETNDIKVLSKETKGPDRFTEATLIKKMEESGIGRPSTYASTMKTLKDRNYIVIEKKKIVPTEQGLLTSKFLADYFSNFINTDYTADMEKKLDKIASGEEREKDVVKEFYDDFSTTFEEKKKLIKPVQTNELCPVCGSPMVYRHNKYGRFEACSNYPQCTYIKKNEPVEKTEIPFVECPKCHKGHLEQRIARKGKKAGKKFYGCSSYPECDFTIDSLSKIKKIQ